MHRNQPYYRYDRYTGDGVTSYQCMNCFTFFSMASIEFLYCPYCGVKFLGRIIRPRYYIFDSPIEKTVTEWIVEQSLTWFVEDGKLEWSDTGYFTHFSTPGEALKFKKELEEQERVSCEKFEKISGKKHPIDRIFRVNRVKKERDCYSRFNIKVSDIKFYKRTKKHIDRFVPDDATYYFEK